MISVLNNLMAGGDISPDYSKDLASDFDLWVEEMEEAAKKMSTNKLHSARLDALLDNDEALASIYSTELEDRGEVINITGYSTLADEPYQDDPEHEDRRKDYLENYAADETQKFIEQYGRDELPF